MISAVLPTQFYNVFGFNYYPVQYWELCKNCHQYNDVILVAGKQNSAQEIDILSFLFAIEQDEHGVENITLYQIELDCDGDQSVSAT